MIAFRVPTQPFRVQHDRQWKTMSPNHFQGTILGHPDTSVLLFVWKDHLLGHIKHRQEHYHLEHPRILRSPQTNNYTRPFPHQSSCLFVIMYRLRDVKSQFPAKLAEPVTFYPDLPQQLSNVKRQAETPDVLEQNTMECSLQITVDHHFVRGAEKDIEYIADEIMFLVLMVNRIYAAQPFNNVWLTMRLKKLIIVENPDKAPNDYRISDPTQNPYKLLHLYSQHVQQECASMLITGRTFTEHSSVLGLAYLKDHKEVGVCAMPFYHPDTRSMISLNSGIMTSKLRFFGLLTRGECAAVLAHELGHLFGATHDSTDNGCPDASLMNSHMDISSEKGHKFSECSRNKINKNVEIGIPCLRQVTPVCGNGYVEANEECDCGTESMCALLKDCCEPKSCKLMPDCTPQVPSKRNHDRKSALFG